MSENMETTAQAMAVEAGAGALEGELDSAWEEDAAPGAGEQISPPAGGAAHANRESGRDGTGESAPAGALEGDSGELFTLKNRDERRQVTRRELIAMAQKGWDYDTVRAERDQLRQFRNEAGPALEAVRANAQRSGMTVPDYLDFCRKRDLMRTGLNEPAAEQALRMEKQKADLDARQAALDAQARRSGDLLQRTRARQISRRQDMERFVQAFPEVKAEDIPRQVWTQVAQGAPLVSAYAMHENQRLKVQLAAQRQDQANRLRTPGALGANSGGELDEMDRIWAEED